MGELFNLEFFRKVAETKEAAAEVLAAVAQVSYTGMTLRGDQ